MKNPYEAQSKKAFWRNAVAERAPFDIEDIYFPKFNISRQAKIVTAGSCFAQHVGRRLKRGGYHVVDAEAAPASLPEQVARRFGYDMYSCRYGNIYTARQLLQLWMEATAEIELTDRVWEKRGRFYDSQRPNVEPDGLPTPAHVLRHRTSHLEHVVSAFRSAEIFVFTFGLTEAWIHTASGEVYPTAPGSIAGAFGMGSHSFKNFRHSEVLDDFLGFRRRMKAINPDIRFLVTVSPVPLTATATDQHVEVATCRSKSTLRSVCAELYEDFDDVDYFPSYEIITSQNARGAYYEANKRSVSPAGVAAAMGAFEQAHGAGERGADLTAPRPDATGSKKTAAGAGDPESDAICEEALLEAFAT